MKVLFVTSWYPTEQNPSAGIFIKEHAVAVQQAGNEVVVLAVVTARTKHIWQTTLSDFCDEHGIRTILLEINTRFFDVVYHLFPLQNFLAKRLVEKHLISDFTPDIIHANVVFPAGIIGRSLARFLRKSYVITEHWSKAAAFVSKPLGYWAKRAYENARAVLPVSEFLKKELQALPMRQPAYRVVGNVIDRTIFRYVPKQRAENELRFCAVATWNTQKTPDKCPELFIEALSRLQKTFPQKLVLTMIGGGNRVGELRTLCEDKGVNALFTGYLSKEAIALELRQADFFLHASMVETFCVVAAEALMCGTPAIVSRVGALPELVDETNGVLCENTAEDWTTGIRRAVDQQFDSLQISETVSARFNLEAIGKRISEVYEELV